jgi:hypothetical protein
MKRSQNTMFNNVILIGRLGQNAEAKTAQNNNEYRAVVVGTHGNGGSYALAIDDDGGFRGCTRRGWLCIWVLYHHFDLPKYSALDCSGPLLFRVPPSVLDLDKLGTGCDFAVKMMGEFDLIAISVQALIAGDVTEEGSVISAAAGASNASSCGGVESGVSAVEGCCRPVPATWFRRRCGVD